MKILTDKERLRIAQMENEQLRAKLKTQEENSALLWYETQKLKGDI